MNIDGAMVMDVVMVDAAMAMDRAVVSSLVGWLEVIIIITDVSMAFCCTWQLEQ